MLIDLGPPFKLDRRRQARNVCASTAPGDGMKPAKSHHSPPSKVRVSGRYGPIRIVPHLPMSLAHARVATLVLPDRTSLGGCHRAVCAARTVPSDRRSCGPIVDGALKMNRHHTLFCAKRWRTRPSVRCAIGDEGLASEVECGRGSLRQLSTQSTTSDRVHCLWSDLCDAYDRPVLRASIAFNGKGTGGHQRLWSRRAPGLPRAL